MIEMEYKDYEALVAAMDKTINTFVNHEKEFDQYDQRSKDIHHGMESIKMTVLNNIRWK